MNEEHDGVAVLSDIHGVPAGCCPRARVTEAEASAVFGRGDGRADHSDRT